MPEQPLSEDQQRLKLHLQTLGTRDLQRLRECFEYELTIRADDKDRIEEILEYIEKVLREKLNS